NERVSSTHGRDDAGGGAAHPVQPRLRLSVQARPKRSGPGPGPTDPNRISARGAGVAGHRRRRGRDRAARRASHDPDGGLLHAHRGRPVRLGPGRRDQRLLGRLRAGGRPARALNLVAWPGKELPLSMLAQVLEGGGSAAREAGVLVIGGHSIHDPEPKYGMAVTGFVDPKDVVRNSTMRPGDRLYLTKPLGLGIITTGVKRRVATPEQLAAAVETMTTTNAAGARVMVEVGVSAATDV